jgi:ankyrin repeat protein
LVNGFAPNLGSPLIYSTISNKLKTIKLLLKYGADPNLIWPLNNKTALYFASFNGFLECCKLLVQNGAIITEDSIEVSGTPEIHEYLENELVQQQMLTTLVVGLTNHKNKNKRLKMDNLRKLKDFLFSRKKKKKPGNKNKQ